MTIKSEPLTTARRQLPPLNGNRIAAVIVWLVGVGSTYLGIKVFTAGAPWWLPASAALIAQLVLTFGERGVWRGRPSFAGLGALAIDVALNAGGIFPYMFRLGETPPAQMVITVFGGGRQVAPLSAMIAAIVLGFLIAALPEDLWMRRE